MAHSPTPDAVVNAAMELAAVSPGDVLYDLGCGDGRVVIRAATGYGARGVGIDYEARLIELAVENAKQAGVEALVKFEERDLIDAEFHDASVVTLFLDGAMDRNLRPRLLRDLRPGARVVSLNSDMGDWMPEKETTVGIHKIYLWVVPQRPTGAPHHQ